jgi:hypothetical protein
MLLSINTISHFFNVIPVEPITPDITKSISLPLFLTILYASFILYSMFLSPLLSIPFKQTISPVGSILFFSKELITLLAYSIIKLYRDNKTKDEESAALAFYYAQQAEKAKQNQDSFWSGLKQLTNF